MFELSGGLTIDGKKYIVIDETNDEPLVRVKFFDEQSLKLTCEERKEVGNALFDKLLEIYKFRNGANHAVH